MVSVRTSGQSPSCTSIKALLSLANPFQFISASPVSMMLCSDSPTVVITPPLTMKAYEGVGVYRHAFLTTALGGGEGSAATPCGNSKWCRLNRTLGRPRVRVRTAEKSLPSTGSELGFLGRPTRSPVNTRLSVHRLFTIKDNMPPPPPSSG